MNRLEQLQQFLKDDPNNSFLKFAIAKEYEGSGEEEKALKTYLELKVSDPSYVGLYYHLAKLFERANKFDKAILIYEEGMAIAKSQGDKHAHGELEAAHWEIAED